MKYIFISYSGLAYPVAYKLQQEGHEVIVGAVQDIRDYVMEEEINNATEDEFNKKRRLDLFKGMLDIRPADKVIDMMKSVQNPHDYFMFFEENNLYRWADKVRDMGFEGNFPTKDDYLFEIDRERAKSFVRKHYPKLKTPEVREFSKIPEAISFLKETRSEEHTSELQS